MWSSIDLYCIVQLFITNMLPLSAHYLSDQLCLFCRQCGHVVSGLKRDRSIVAIYLTVSEYCLPSKHKTLVEHLYNVGLTSKTLGRRCPNFIHFFLCLLGYVIFCTTIEILR